MMEQLAFGGALGVTAYYSPWIWRRGQARYLRARLAESRTLVLTYDDGPSDTVTPRVVDALRAYDARATFFMLASAAAEHSDIVDLVTGAGHDVGCHSDQHVNAWKATPWRATRDIAAGYEKLARWVKPNGMFRPPHGKMTLPTYWHLRRRGASVWWWTIDSGDTHQTRPAPQAVADRVVAEQGGIVLLHDDARTLDHGDFVLETTRLLLESATREGLKVKTLSEVQACLR